MNKWKRKQISMEIHISIRLSWASKIDVMYRCIWVSMGMQLFYIFHRYEFCFEDINFLFEFIIFFNFDSFHLFDSIFIIIIIISFSLLQKRSLLNNFLKIYFLSFFFLTSLILKTRFRQTLFSQSNKNST